MIIGNLIRLTNKHDLGMTIYLFNLCLCLLERRCLCITGILGQGMMGGGLSVFGNIGDVWDVIDTRIPQVWGKFIVFTSFVLTELSRYVGSR